MKLRAIAGLICCAALLALPAGAGAKAPPIKTSIIIDDGQPGGLGLELLGHLTSPNPKCVSGRTVKLFFVYTSTGRTLADTDLSSTHGIWALTGDNTDFTSIHLVVARKAFGPKGHRRVCARITTQVV